MKSQRRWGLSATEVIIAGAAVLVPVALLAGVGRKMFTLSNDVAVAAEILQLSACCGDFYERYNAYPPDMHDPNDAILFMQRAFPKCPAKNYPKFENYSPASALPLWFAGVDGRGLNEDPTNPFGTTGKREPPMMEFAPDRLKPNDKGVLQYYPKDGTDGSPYVYFCAKPANEPGKSTGSPELAADPAASRATATTKGSSRPLAEGKGGRVTSTPAFRAATAFKKKTDSSPRQSPTAGRTGAAQAVRAGVSSRPLAGEGQGVRVSSVAGTKKCDPKSAAGVPALGYAGHPGWPPAKPYLCTDDGQWINVDSFQIISPGQDGKFGSGNHFPKGDNYNEANLDDISNFSNGARMQRAMPGGPNK